MGYAERDHPGTSPRLAERHVRMQQPPAIWKSPTVTPRKSRMASPANRNPRPTAAAVIVASRMSRRRAGSGSLTPMPSDLARPGVPARLLVPSSRIHRGEQVAAVERLGQKRHRPGIERATARLPVAVGGEDDDGKLVAVVDQPLLK